MFSGALAECVALFTVLLPAVEAQQGKLHVSIYRYQCMGLEGKLQFEDWGSFAAMVVFHFAWPSQESLCFFAAVV